MYTENNVPRNRRLWTLKSAGEKPVTGVRIKAEKKFGLKEEHFIICRNCGNTITTPQYIIAVNEQHIHMFTNPVGITYQIGCFSSADGCIDHGDLTLDHTWFEGFSWNFAICSNCLIHLGWFYQSGNESFFGLILDRLVDTKEVSGLDM